MLAAPQPGAAKRTALRYPFAASRARRSLRRIFPLADFGISSMNSTTRTFLCGRDALGDERHHVVGGELGAEAWVTTNALGTSSPSSSRTPMTATSAILSWVSSRASSSAGGTW